MVGAGPVGLATALGLARHGIRSVLVERSPATSRTSKAPAIHVRTREVFRQWGVEDRFVSAGRLHTSLTLHSVESGKRLLALDFSDLGSEADRPGLLVLEQNETERLLLEAVRESGLCEVRFSSEAVGLTQDSEGVTLTLRGDRPDEELRARFVVGCDGARSFVRGALGQPFEGGTYGLRPILADVEIADRRDALPEPRTSVGGQAFSFAVRLRPGLWRIVHLAHGGPEHDDVGEGEVTPLVDRLLGPAPPGGQRARVRWSSRFQIHVRASPRFRVGRVLLAGDAAHVHSPASGFGMNGGIQDAHNLAWKLEAALGGGDVDRLLNSYEVERKAVVVEDVSRYTDRLTRVFVQAPAPARKLAWTVVRTLTRIPPVRRRMLRRTAMLDLAYPPSPLLRQEDPGAGVRLPNPLLRGVDGARIRLYDLLPCGPAIVDVHGEEEPSADLPLEDVIRIGRGAYDDRGGRLRSLFGAETGWILVRPDTYVAWAWPRDGQGDHGGLRRAAQWSLGRGTEG